MSWAGRTSIALLAILAISILGTFLVPALEAQSPSLEHSKNSQLAYLPRHHEHLIPSKPLRPAIRFGPEAAKGFVMLIATKMKAIANLSKQYNVTLPQNLREVAVKALNLIREAIKIVDKDPKRGIELALAASRIFAPVALYVIKHVPQEAVKEEVSESIERCIEARMRAVENLEKLVQRLEEHGVEVPERIEKALEKARELLEEAMNATNSGNIREARRLIGEASKHIAFAMREISRGLGHAMVRLAAVEASAHRVARAVLGIARAINVSLEALENNATDKALRIAGASERIVNRTLVFIERVLDLLKARNLSDTNTSRGLEILANSLQQVSTYLSEAVEALKIGETELANNYLSTAIEILKSGMEESASYLKPVALYLHHVSMKVGKLMRVLGAEMAKAMGRELGSIAMVLSGIDAKIHIAIVLYRQGKINASTLLKTLNTAQHRLAGIAKQLRRIHAPPWMIHRVISLIQWIEHVKHRVLHHVHSMSLSSPMVPRA